MLNEQPYSVKSPLISFLFFPFYWKKRELWESKRKTCSRTCFRDGLYAFQNFEIHANNVWAWATSSSELLEEHLIRCANEAGWLRKWRTAYVGESSMPELASSKASKFGQGTSQSINEGSRGNLAPKWDFGRCIHMQLWVIQKKIKVKGLNSRHLLFSPEEELHAR